MPHAIACSDPPCWRAITCRRDHLTLCKPWQLIGRISDHTPAAGEDDAVFRMFFLCGFVDCASQRGIGGPGEEALCRAALGLPQLNALGKSLGPLSRATDARDLPHMFPQGTNRW